MRKPLFGVLFALLFGAACAQNAATPAPTQPKAETLAPKAPAYEAGGMWMPRQLAALEDTLNALGLEIPADRLADPEKAPLAGIVSLGGCSASFVSPDGLIVTNHHCVTGILQYNSTPEKNLLTDGFSAKTRADEAWAGPTQKAYVVRRIEDVTETMTAGLSDITDARQRYLATETREKELLAACEQDRPEVRCRLAKFFGGQEYQLIEQVQIKDIRLVYAPPASVGNYGGDIDNWMWPRHTGDFAFLRAYVGPTGESADHAKENVPFKPAHHLPVAAKGVEKGDLVFIAGYPGRTSRLATAHSARNAVEWKYPRSIAQFNEYISLLEELSAGDKELTIKATPWLRGLNNYKKKYEGMMAGLKEGGLLEKRTATEAQLAAWISTTPDRIEQYGDLLPKMTTLQEEWDKTRERDAALSEVARFSSMLRTADTIVHMAMERPKADADRDPSLQERNWKRIEGSMKAMERRYDRTLDRGLLGLALERALRLPGEERPQIVKTLVGNATTPAAIRTKLDRMYRRTKLESAENRIALFQKATLKQLRRSRDPFIQAALVLRGELQELEDRGDAYAGEMLLLAPRYHKALQEMAGKPVAPDANSTLRVTFGTVKGYAPKADADVYHPFTYASEMAAKHTGEEPFNAPSKALEAIKEKRFGPYAVDGKLPVDFLSDTDITNGNSGSAAINARGEIIGLAFDGNYEAMASDWMFMPEITRTITTDIRYVLWVLDLLDGHEVLRELGVEPAL